MEHPSVKTFTCRSCVLSDLQAQLCYILTSDDMKLAAAHVEQEHPALHQPPEQQLQPVLQLLDRVAQCPKLSLHPHRGLAVVRVLGRQRVLGIVPHGELWVGKHGL